MKKQFQRQAARKRTDILGSLAIITSLIAVPIGIYAHAGSQWQSGVATASGRRFEFLFVISIFIPLAIWVLFFISRIAEDFQSKD